MMDAKQWGVLKMSPVCLQTKAIRAAAEGWAEVLVGRILDNITHDELDKDTRNLIELNIREAAKVGFLKGWIYAQQK